MRLVSALALTLLTPTTGAGQQAKAPDMPHLSPEVLAGLATTLSSSAAYDRQSHLGPSFSAGFWYGSEPRYSLGASYELFGLGSGASQRGVDSIEARYAAHALWAAGRLYPYLEDGVGVFAGIRLGLVFMRQRASGVRSADFTLPASDPFSCANTSTPNLGLAAGFGLDMAVTQRLAVVTQLGASMLRGSSDVVDGCAPGRGSVVVLNVNLGLAYHFGL